MIPLAVLRQYVKVFFGEHGLVAAYVSLLHLAPSARRSTLDAQGTSLLLPVKIGTMDISELHSVKALLDCRATRSFINRDFVRSKGINIRILSRNIPVF